MKHRNLGIWDVNRKSEFWKVLAKRINADFRIVATVSRDLKRLELNFEYEKVKVIFSESDTKPLFVTCNFSSDTGLTWFELSKVDFIEKVLSKFSSNKLHSTNSKFDKSYLTKGTEHQKIRSIINNKSITELILQNDLTFIGGEQKKDGKFSLTLNVHRNVNNIKQLEAIHNLTTMLIDVMKGRKTDTSQRS